MHMAHGHYSPISQCFTTLKRLCVHVCECVCLKEISLSPLLDSYISVLYPPPPLFFTHPPYCSLTLPFMSLRCVMATCLFSALKDIPKFGCIQTHRSSGWLLHPSIFVNIRYSRSPQHPAPSYTHTSPLCLGLTTEVPRPQAVTQWWHHWIRFSSLLVTQPGHTSMCVCLSALRKPNKEQKHSHHHLTVLWKSRFIWTSLIMELFMLCWDCGSPRAQVRNEQYFICTVLKVMRTISTHHNITSCQRMSLTLNLDHSKLILVCVLQWSLSTLLLVVQRLHMDSIKLKLRI